MCTETTRYDSIGAGYARRRRPDPTIAAALRSALGDARRIVNVGAGAGSYEPPDITAAPVEPSAVMAAQRPPALVPAVLTIHHWHDLRRGLQELRRVTNGPIVILTADPDVASSWWLPVDYPELDIEIEARVAERLAADLRAGRWDRRHGELRTLSEFDTGLRLVIAHG